MLERTTPLTSLRIRCTLLAAALVGVAAYAVQNERGLAVTGMSRDVSWGLYISQFTFMVGLAASSVLVIVPQYVHRATNDGLLVIGEALAVTALVEAFAFVFVDLGRPSRLIGLLLHASPSSMMVWDLVLLTTYLLFCITILTTKVTMGGTEQGGWLRGVVLASIPFAVGIHIVTALLYSGLAARVGWMSALLAPRFLASAFASGAALLLLLATSRALAERLRTSERASGRLAVVQAYALLATVLFASMEAFSGWYSRSPWALLHLKHGFDLHAGGQGPLALLGHGLLVFALALLIAPRTQGHVARLRLASIATVGGVFIDKALLFVPSGFAPSPFGHSPNYWPSVTEILVTLGIHATGVLVFLELARVGLPPPPSPALRHSTGTTDSATRACHCRGKPCPATSLPVSATDVRRSTRPPASTSAPTTS